MKRIAIATITITVDNENAYNYGNKLQAFALQEFLRDEGHYCQTIRYKVDIPENTGTKNGKKKECFSQKIDDAKRVIRRKIYANVLFEMNKKRRDAFEDFAKEHIVYTEMVYNSSSDFLDIKNGYDLFIVGSDQVWNPYCEGSNEFYYLTFAPKEKRIAYAPSIAVNDIPEEMVNKYHNWLSGFERLSIREEAGKNLIKEKLHMDAELVCDPVFLLDKQKWAQIATETFPKGTYFATYFLGKQDITTKRYIKELENKTGLKHIDIYTRDNPDSAFAGPEEFLGLIKNAAFLCTDSFHGTAFSIIFNVPMIIFERKGKHKMNSRIEGVLKIASIYDRSIERILCGTTDIYDVEFDKDGTLNDLIKSSKQYLCDEISKR